VAAAICVRPVAVAEERQDDASRDADGLSGQRFHPELEVQRVLDGELEDGTEATNDPELQNLVHQMTEPAVQIPDEIQVLRPLAWSFGRSAACE
jgi:hypothetical protein